MTGEVRQLSVPLSIVCGLLWGVAVMLADTLSQPVADLSMQEWVVFSLGVLVIYAPTGMVWVFGAQAAEVSRHPAAVYLLLPPIAIGVSLLMETVPLPPGWRVSAGMAGLVTEVPLRDIVWHLLWLNLFYGGVYALGYVSTRRALRLSANLAELNLVRSEAEARLDEARAQAVRGQVRPSMLVGALTALQGRYGSDRTAAEILLDRIVGFLRAAMPGLRNRGSSLTEEVGLLHAYDQLRRLVDIEGVRWRLELSPPAHDIALPSARLLPALDRIAACLEHGQTLEVVAAPSSDAYLIEVRCRGRGRVDVERLGHVLAELRMAFGKHAVTQDPASPATLLTVRLAHAERPGADLRSPSELEAPLCSVN